jgi:hypothetical protein
MQFPILASALRVSTRLAHGGLIVLAGSLLAGSMIAGCANGSGDGMDTGLALPDVPFVRNDASVVDAPRDTGVDAPRDSGVDAPIACSSVSCSTNSDCGLMCPLNPTGANCCDTALGRCFASTATMCPLPATDAGTTMY